ncbi:MAG: isochorismatase family protein [Syntrophaceae bacterium]|nr:isochorismatase family protein [Syntrophaceae bacterium]
MNKTENITAIKQVRPGLVLMDVQNQFMPYMAEKSSKITFDTINGTIALFRQSGCPVIRVYHTDPQMGPSPGTDEFQFDPAFHVEDSDPKFVKNFPNAFKKTDLHKFLQEKEINTIFLSGLSAVGCVLATYFSAIDLEYNVFMLKNGIMSHNSSFTKFAEDAMESVSVYTLKFILTSRQF